MRQAPARLIALALILPVLFPAVALAVKRPVIRELQAEYAGHSYQLRMDLRATDYFAAFNVVNDQGIHYRGRELGVLFYQLETVYVDRISNEAEKEVRLTLYRSRNDARQIRGSVPSAPLPVGPDRETTLGNFARDLSTNVLLEIRTGKEDPDAQQAEIIALLERLFYLKETPTYQQKEEFVLSHPDLPLQRLAAITSLGEDLVLGILKRREVAKP